MDLSWKNRALLIGDTVLIPLKGYRACWRGLKSSTGIYFSSKLCMQNSHKKCLLMNLSCSELARPFLGDPLWHRCEVHNLSHPCPPPFSSSPRGKNPEEKLSAANPLAISFEMGEPLRGPVAQHDPPGAILLLGSDSPCRDTSPSAQVPLAAPCPSQPPSSGVDAALEHLAESQGFTILA